jgi:hypothetical protein
LAKSSREATADGDQASPASRLLHGPEWKTNRISQPSKSSYCDHLKTSSSVFDFTSQFSLKSINSGNYAALYGFGNGIGSMNLGGTHLEIRRDGGNRRPLTLIAAELQNNHYVLGL